MDKEVNQKKPTSGQSFIKAKELIGCGDDHNDSDLLKISGYSNVFSKNCYFLNGRARFFGISENTTRIIYARPDQQ